MGNKNIKHTFEYVNQRIKDINPNIELLEDEYFGNKYKMKCKCLIDSHEWKATFSDLNGGHGCPKCGGSLKKTTQEAFLEINKIHGDKIEILSNEYKNANSKLRVMCLIDNHEWETTYSRLINRKYGCPVCDGKSVKIGVNDITTTFPHMIKFLKNKEDAFNYTHKSNVKLDMVCPECGFEKKMTPHTFTEHGIMCNMCSDGISLPNKMIYNVLSQCGVLFEVEKTILGYKYRYDAYFEINSNKYLIEMHGAQHYDMEKYEMWQPIGFNAENDKNKKQVATDCGYTYIEIDCRKSNLEFIKNNIIKSLSSILDLSNIDWDNVFLNSSNSMLVYVCKIRKNSDNTKTPADIKMEIHGLLSDVTIRKYLKIGNKLGLCIYIASEDFKKTRRKRRG